MHIYYGKWESSIKFFESITDNPRYGLQAREMLKIIPVIRSDTDLKDVLGWASHGVLALWLPENPLELRVWAEDENNFFIYIHNIKTGIGLESEHLSREQLLPTLKFYLLSKYHFKLPGNFKNNEGK